MLGLYQRGLDRYEAAQSAQADGSGSKIVTSGSFHLKLFHRPLGEG